MCVALGTHNNNPCLTGGQYDLYANTVRSIYNRGIR
jgi:hypothetical protein